MSYLERTRGAVNWVILILTLVYIITGLGLVYSNVVGPATFGLLTKGLSFKIHKNLLVPFLIVLLLHIAPMFRLRKDLPDKKK